MPRVRGRSQSATTDQPADSGVVPGQRDTQEGGNYPAQTEYGQPQGRHAGPQAPGEPAEYRSDARQRSYAMPGSLMVLSGMLTFFIGITGVIRGIFFNNVANYPFYFSVRSRGVLLLVIGAVAFVVGLGLLLRVSRARHIATVVAIASAVANFMFLPFYPFWSVIILAMDVLIIWELTRDRGGRREFAHLPGRTRVSADASADGERWLPPRRSGL
jgi:hypothetical protein